MGSKHTRAKARRLEDLRAFTFVPGHIEQVQEAVRLYTELQHRVWDTVPETMRNDAQEAFLSIISGDLLEHDILDTDIATVAEYLDTYVHPALERMLVFDTGNTTMDMYKATIPMDKAFFEEYYVQEFGMLQDYLCEYGYSTGLYGPAFIVIPPKNRTSQ